MQQNQQTKHTQSAKYAAHDHRDHLLERVRNTQRIPDDDWCQQTKQMAKEQANHADVKQDIAKPQIARMQHLRGITLPSILLTFETRQAAEQENCQCNVGIDPVNKLM